MKNLRYIFIAVISLAFSACVQENYAPGAPDLEDCMGFYFPQSGAGDYMLDPSDPTVMEFTAERKNTQYEAAIEVKVSNDSIFRVSEIFFPEGAKTAKFTVDFSAAKTGVKYTCTISVDDPAYVSQYGLESNELTFSVLRASWKNLGKGLWRDDFMSSGFSCALPYHETQCDVFEREDLPGYYRIDNVYTAEYLAEMIDGDPAAAPVWAEYLTESSIMINATNPSKAYIEMSPIGVNMGERYGDVVIYSYVPEFYGPTLVGSYGSVKDGIITMPKTGVVFELTLYGALLANQSGKFRLVLPGYVPYDYSIELSSEETTDGVVPVTFEFGSDVKSVKYAVFEGKINEVEMVSKVEQIKTGTVAVKTLTQPSTLELSIADLKATGLYTLVACSFDKTGAYQAYASTSFGFDADGSRKVDIKAGLIVSDKYAPEGLTSENSMEYYVYGSDITEAKLAIYKKSNYDDYKETIQNEVSVYMDALTEVQLDMINNSGYTGVVGGLSADTEYVLVVYAKNGYHSVFFDEVYASTTGTFDPLQEAYTFYDIPGRLQSPDAKELYVGGEDGKEWQLWSLDIFKQGAEGREFRNTVEVYDYFDKYVDKAGQQLTEKDGKYYYDDGIEVPADVNITTVDCVRIRGMFPETVSEYGIVNYVDFEFYEGYLFSLVSYMPGVKYNGQNLYPVNMYYYYSMGWGIAIETWAMFGGFTEDGVIAFVANPYDASANYIAMGLGYFTNDNYSGNGSPFQEAHGYPILVSPDSPYLKGDAAPSALKAPKSCEMLSTALEMGRSNYVETERGYIKSTIDQFKSTPYNYLENTENVTVKAENAPVDFTVKAVARPASKVETGALKNVRLVEAK